MFKYVEKKKFSEKKVLGKFLVESNLYNVTEKKVL
jgi:hypothetical protein